jgi:hypothetical protein
MRFLKVVLMALLVFTPAITFASAGGEGAGRSVASSHKTKAKKKKKSAKTKAKGKKKTKGKKVAKKTKKTKKAKRHKKAARATPRKPISHQPAEEMSPDPSQNFEITPEGTEGQDELPPPNAGDLSE